MCNGARRGDGCRESNVLEVLDADTAVCLCGGGEINLDPLISRIAYLRTARPVLAGVVEVESKVDFRGGRKGDAAEDVQDAVFQVVASIHD